MFDWYYNQLKKKYGDNCTLLYTDTDSLLVSIKTPNIYKDMQESKDEYDFSDYPKDHPLYDESNKKVIGKMKDVCAGTPIAEYVGLRPKLYSILRSDEQLIKKAKGVKIRNPKTNRLCKPQRCALSENKIHTQHEYAALNTSQHIWVDNKQNNPLAPYTKRYIAPDGITTFAFGMSQE